jgi:hypothetical protein
LNPKGAGIFEDWLIPAGVEQIGLLFKVWGHREHRRGHAEDKWMKRRDRKILEIWNRLAALVCEAPEGTRGDSFYLKSAGG